MKDLLKSWKYSVVIALAVGAGLGVAIVLFLPSDSESESDIFSMGDRLLLAIPGELGSSGSLQGGSGLDLDSWTEALPLTAAEAVATGWKDPDRCSPGQGRFFQKTAEGEVLPYILLYNDNELLAGVYLYSSDEVPDPWARVDNLVAGGLTLIDYEHWGLFMYFRDPTC